MTIDALLELAKKKELNEESLLAFKERLAMRECQFASSSREQEADDKFLARGYDL